MIHKVFIRIFNICIHIKIIEGLARAFSARQDMNEMNGRTAAETDRNRGRARLQLGIFLLYE